MRERTGGNGLDDSVKAHLMIDPGVQGSVKMRKSPCEKRCILLGSMGCRHCAVGVNRGGIGVSTAKITPESQAGSLSASPGLFRNLRECPYDVQKFSVYISSMQTSVDN